MIRLIVVVALLSGSAAKAQELTDVPEAPGKAIELFEQASRHYREGRFKNAAGLLEEAYRLHPEPVLLFNLGRALESDGDALGAIKAYTKYLNSDGARDRAGIDARIVRLQERLEKEKQLERLQAEKVAAERAAAVPAPVVLAPDPTPSVRKPIGERRLRPSRAPWIVVGLGAAVLAGGSVVGLFARRDLEAAAAATNQRVAADDERRARDLARGANLGMGVGAATIAAGLIWAAIEHRRGLRDLPRVSVRLGPSGLGLEGTFR